MLETYDSLRVTHLTPEQHLQTCGYWFTVQDHCTPHTAFATHSGLERWMLERGLSFERPLGDAPDHVRILGTYRTESHLHDADAFDSIQGERTRTMSNADWVVAVLERGEDGSITVHTLNPNVRDRQVFDYHESNSMMS